MGMNLLRLVSCGVAFDVKTLTFLYQIKKTQLYMLIRTIIQYVCVCVLMGFVKVSHIF